MQVVRTLSPLAARLMGDRAYLIRSIVADNPAAVAEQFAGIDSGNRFRTTQTPQGLADMLVMMQREPEDRPFVDQCINVPWRGTVQQVAALGAPSREGGSYNSSLQTAVEEIRERARFLGADGADTRGLAALVDLARQDNSTAAEADDTVSTSNANAAALADTAAKDAALRRFGKWAIAGTLALLCIVAYVLYKRKNA